MSLNSCQWWLTGEVTISELAIDTSPSSEPYLSGLQRIFVPMLTTAMLTGIPESGLRGL
jgi:hypothetical protein